LLKRTGDINDAQTEQVRGMGAQEGQSDVAKKKASSVQHAFSPSDMFASWSIETV
jgi:hypothetical protein